MSAPELWPWLVGIAAFIVAVATASHVILHKRDVRAAIGWTGLVLLTPFLGSIAYYLLGINRIRRRAIRLTGRRTTAKRTAALAAHGAEAAARLGDRFARLDRAERRVTHAPLLEGNAIAPLVDGDEAFPAMLQAIAEAERSVLLATYIMDNDRAGQDFVEALAAATARGVEVRVLIDGVGARYSRPPITRSLKRRGVSTAVFLPTRFPLVYNSYFHLRNHRKLLVVDGRLAFTGGINIRDGCVLAEPSAHPVQDVHFRVAGPVVAPLFAIGADDWHFASGERLTGDAWTSATPPAGEVAARAIADGPGEDFETLRWTIMAALGAAAESVLIATPYFLPDLTLLAALRLASMRGVRVDILLPEKLNLRVVQWAATAQLWQALEAGCRVWLGPPPFDHSKLMVVDGAWSLIGSANWDMRSLRLNFELGVTCFDRSLAARLTSLMNEKMEKGRRLTQRELDTRSLPVRLRDATARLFAPYL